MISNDELIIIITKRITKNGLKKIMLIRIISKALLHRFTKRSIKITLIIITSIIS